MSDVAGAAGAAEKIGTGADAAGAGADAAAAAAAAAAGGDKGAAGGDADGDAGKSPWAATWREDIVKGLPDADKVLEKAKRFASPTELMKSVLAGESKISELTEAQKSLLKIPGKDAKPEEVAAFRKALNVPEKAELYDYKAPEGREMSELDKQADEIYKAEALKMGLSIDQYRQSRGVLDRVNEMVDKQRDANMLRAAQITEDSLRVEYGADYRGNMNLAETFIAENMSADAAKFMDMRMEDGTKVGAFAPFVKMIVNLARASADGGPLVSGVSDGVGLDQRIAEIEKMQIADPKQYATDKIQKEFDGLLARQARLSQSKG
jgi:hypothetical protein